MQPINPYQPSSIDAEDAFDPAVGFQFDGTIGVDDYRMLLPERWLAGAVWFIYFFCLCFVLGGLGILISAVRGNVPLNIVGASAAMVAIGVLLGTFASWAANTRWRARRYLKKSPDLLGIARGQINEHGLWNFDGSLLHWFSPSLLQRSRITRSGIAVILNANQPLRYLALSAELLPNYATDLGRKLRDAWKHSVKQSALKINGMETQDPGWGSVAMPRGKAFWIPADDQPFTVRFAGPMALQHPVRTLVQRQLATTTTFGFLNYVAIGGFGWWMGTLWAWVAVLPIAFMIPNVWKVWKSYFTEAVTETWDQAGWIDNERFSWRTDEYGFQIALEQFETATINDELLTLTLPTGQVFFVHRSMVGDDEAWQTVGGVVSGIVDVPARINDGPK